MKFSLLFELQCADASPEGEQQVLHECVEQALFAEQMGFDRIWAVEHHSLKWYAHMSAPEVFLTWVAARTERIRVGHGVVCMPFGYNHPLRVAEKAAMLDALSGGRLDLGAGRGVRRLPDYVIGEEVGVGVDIGGLPARLKSHGAQGSLRHHRPKNHRALLRRTGFRGR